MALQNVTLHNFAAGELSPKMRGRYDLPVYYAGCERLFNFISQTQGPATYRTGTRFVNHTRRNNPANLISFQFNDEQAYELEFTEGYIRFFKDEAVIVESDTTITGATQANPVVITSASHGYSNGDEIFIYDVVGMTELNGKSYLVANVAANTYELQDSDGNNIDGTGYTAYTSGGVGQKIYEITTPYQEEHLFQLRVSQNADVMYIDHQWYEPRKLTRTGHTAWTLSLYTRTADPFLDKKTITAITQASPAVVTSASHGYSNGDYIIIETVVGMTEVNGCFFKVANVAANTFELQDIDGNNIDSTGYTAYVSDGYASDQTLLPGVVAFYESRCWHARTGAEPESFWGSRTPDGSTTRYDDFTTGTDDDHAIAFTIGSSVSSEVNPIRFMAGTDQFLGMGTFGAIQKVTGDTATDPITPSSIHVRPTDFDGVEDIIPVVKDKSILYVQKGDRVFSSLEYDVIGDSYQSIDRTLVSDHITLGGVKQIAFQRGRPDVAWLVLDTGKLIGLTYKQKEDVSGWHQHKTDNGNDWFFSVSIMPRTDKQDQVWVVVKRTINGATKYYVEFFEDEPDIPERDDYYTGEDNEADDKAAFLRAMFEAQKTYVHVDSALTYDGRDAGSDAGATVTPAAVSGTSVTFTAGASVFASTDVGREIWKEAVSGAGTGRAVITAFVSGTEVTCKITENFDSTDTIPAGDWFLTTNSISGLDHLEGETVKIIIDGGTHTDKTVSSGSITLDHQGSMVHVGIGYRGILKSMNLEVGGTFGPAQTKRKNVYKCGIRFLNTLGAKFGTRLYHMKQVLYRSTGDIISRPPPLRSGDEFVPFDDSWRQNKQMVVLQEEPLPCTVQMLVPFVRTDN